MLLGKRPRPSMRRTTSLTEFTVDLTHIEPPAAVPVPVPVSAPARSDQSNNNNCPYYPNMKDREPNHPNYPNTKDREPAHLARRNTVSGGDTNTSLLSMVSPRNQRRNSTDFTVETPYFLRVCGLCQCSLRPGRDIYMYRGDTAFCSSECRQQQMNHDERKEKCSVASNKEIQPSTVSRSETSSKGETVAAA